MYRYHNSAVETLIRQSFSIFSKPDLTRLLCMSFLSDFLELIDEKKFCVQKKMSSLVERLRIRSDRKPVYNLDDSDDDDFLPKKDRTLEQVEAIVRTDAVCCLYS